MSSILNYPEFHFGYYIFYLIRNFLLWQFFEKKTPNFLTFIHVLWREAGIWQHLPETEKHCASDTEQTKIKPDDASRWSPPAKEMCDTIMSTLQFSFFLSFFCSFYILLIDKICQFFQIQLKIVTFWSETNINSKRHVLFPFRPFIFYPILCDKQEPCPLT